MKMTVTTRRNSIPTRDLGRPAVDADPDLEVGDVGYVDDVNQA